MFTPDIVSDTVARSSGGSGAAVQTPKSVLMTRNSLGVSTRKEMFYSRIHFHENTLGVKLIL